ncbi:hypothetical protein [Nesterenkonia natronophila]|uniref:Uncharacterized protein n=1 Tax=Nesterenkonia natronophila TaxID=2174932 RepID=A0A3A4F048_9MICC|nr:hypothetical protein [Nesterenkonia natronophila]RJN31061.1 hypothetical protein D3250_09315 [Nesterenkonia natronophila]
MPDKPLDNTWVGTRVLPAARRAKRAGRRIGRRARSAVAPRIGALGAAALNAATTDLTIPSSGAEQVRRCGVVVLGIPDYPRIPPLWREKLIQAERHSVPTVLMVRSPEDIEHPLAAVVTHLVTTDPQLLAAVRDFAGAERTGMVDSLASGREQTSALFALTRVHTPVEKT